MTSTQVVPANSRGGVVLLHEDYRYVRNWQSTDKRIWRCTHTGCGAYLQSNLFDVFDDNAAIQGKFADFTPHYVIEKL